MVWRVETAVFFRIRGFPSPTQLCFTSLGQEVGESGHDWCACAEDNEAITLCPARRQTTTNKANAFSP